MSLSKKILRIFFVLLLLLVAVLLFNTFTYSSKQLHPQQAAPLHINLSEAVERFSGGLQFKTISKRETTSQDDAAFLGFHDYLVQQYPLIHQQLKKEVLNKYDLFYTLKGSDPSLEPIILMAHYDVAPVASATIGNWSHPPFAGHVSDGYIWGRGTLDMKGTLFAEMEAIEHLLNQGFIPKRTIHLVFGHDEEVGGKMGNKKIAALLKQKGIHAFFVLDEGLPIVEGLIPGVDNSVAMIGIAEKGYLSLGLTVHGKGGHSSTPPDNTAIGVLSTAITKIESNPFPSELKGAAQDMFNFIGPEMSFMKRLVFANQWLFSPLIAKQLASTHAGKASLKTTTAVTMVEGGIKENVLPQLAKAVINHRIIPGENIATVKAHIEAVVNDARVEVSEVGYMHSNPSKIVSTSSDQFKLLQKSIMQVFPDVIAAPGLFIAGSDSRYYGDVSDNILKFFPWRLNKKELITIHGVDERLTVKNYGEAIHFYYQLIKNATY